MKIDILAIGVHPDDVELACSGTLLKHLNEGKTVGLLDLTRGELGTRGTAETRDQEANDSLKLMGASFRYNLEMADGFFGHTRENLLKIIRVIRQSQPKIILSNAINDRHPDHGRAAKLINDASFLSGLVKINTLDDKGNDQKPWRANAVYNYIQDYYIKPDFVIDITEYMDKKIELVMAFKTQFFNPDSDEPTTPISSKDFIDFLYARCRDYGRPTGVKFAEGYTSPRTIGVNSLFDLF